MTRAYQTGFVKRAHELGFDGNALLKYAAVTVWENPLEQEPVSTTNTTLPPPPVVLGVLPFQIGGVAPAPSSSTGILKSLGKLKGVRGITRQKVLELMRRAVRSKGRGAMRAFDAADDIAKAQAKGTLTAHNGATFSQNANLSQTLREFVRDNGIESVESGVKALKTVPPARFGEPETTLQWAGRVLKQQPPTTSELVVPNHLMNSARYAREAIGIR